MQSETASSLYLEAMRHVYNHGTLCSPRDIGTRELNNVHMSVREPEFGPMITQDADRNKVLLSYMSREMDLYLSGELDAAAWRDKASKFWWELRNPDGTINSNYGHLTMHLRDAPGVWGSYSDGITQWEWACKCLTADPDTRQAIMHFNRPLHQWHGNKDFPCTMHGMFRIRQGCLDYITVMRSQDLVKGFPYDVPYFIWQLETMAKDINLPVGCYDHFVHSLHYYDSDEDTLKRMIYNDNC